MREDKCAGHRHFLGFSSGAPGGAADAASDAEPSYEHANHRNPYLMRQLMGFCMFHGCEEVALLGEADLPSHGVGGGGGGTVLFV